MRIAALDLSLTCTGVAKYTPTEDGSDHAIAVATLEPPASEGTGIERLFWHLRHVLAWTDGCDLTVIEGYSYGSKNTRAHATGELGGVVKLGLWTRQRTFVVVPPAIRAKVATGKGNAGKDAVLVEAVKRLGYEGSSKDEADARWLLEAALQFYGLPGRAELPKTHTTKLADGVFPAPEALVS